MGLIFSDQRRLVAVGTAIALVAAALVLALIFAARPPAPGPAAAATTPGHASSVTAGASASATPSEARMPDPSGSGPIEPAPPAPAPPAPPAPAPPAPGAPFPAALAGGHRIGNHSMTHPGFTGLPDAAIGDQLTSAQQAIQAAGGDPRPLFRFPFGERDARTIATVNRLGYLPVRWTVDTLGWKGASGGITAQVVADRVLAQLRPGEIVLMHVGANPNDGTTLDADALGPIIARIQDAGYGFTALDALLG